MFITDSSFKSYQNPRLHEKWQSVYRVDSFQKALDKKILDRFIRYLNVPRNGKVLDAGCGTGEHTLNLARCGFQCIGVDVSEYVLQRAMKQASENSLTSQVSFVQAALGDLPFPDAHFDAMHCRGVLMHIPCWREALQQICRVLKMGGRLIISENNDKAVEAFLVRFVRPFETVIHG